MLLYYMMLFLAPFMDYPYLPSIGTFTLIKLVGMLAVIAAAMKAAGEQRPMLLFNSAESRLFVVLFLIIVVSTAIHGFPDGASTLIQTYSAFAMFLFTTLAMVDSIAKVKTSCIVILASMFIASLYVYNGYFRWGVQRSGGVVGDPNYYALIAISVLPMSILLQGSTTGLTRLFINLTSLSLLVSIIFGGSRAGFLSIAISGFYLLMYMRRRLLVLVVGATLTIIVLIVVPTSPLDRLLHPTTEAISSSQERSKLVEVAVKIIADNPLLGVGPAQFKRATTFYRPVEYSAGGKVISQVHIAHNTYLNLAAELGVFGAVAFVAILVCAWWRARRMAQWARSQSPPANVVLHVARGIEVGLVGYAFAATFLTADYIKHFWIIVFLGVAMNRVILETRPVLGRLLPVPSRGQSPQRGRGVVASPRR